MKILVTGAFGQIGTELTCALREKYGNESIIASSHRLPEEGSPARSNGPCDLLDVTDGDAVADSVRRHRIDVIYHLAAKLSAAGEQDPQLAWTVNMDGLHNVLEAARTHGVQQVFWPSSIAAFGPESPREETPQETVMRPTTIYGVCKVAGELMCDYYVRRYGLDVRGVRYPGVVSSAKLPSGGTTDYAVEIFYSALKTASYTCFVREETRLPMIYMPDCIKAALDLMDADFGELHHHNGFNLASMSFSAGELAAEIKKHIPDFICRFQADERQAIADSWPCSIDDRAAREEWNWQPEYNLSRMTTDMLKNLRMRLEAGQSG